MMRVFRTLCRRIGTFAGDPPDPRYRIVYDCSTTGVARYPVQFRERVSRPWITIAVGSTYLQAETQLRAVRDARPHALRPDGDLVLREERATYE